MLQEELSFILKDNYMIKIAAEGDFDKTESFLDALKERLYLRKLDRYGRLGVEALAHATPRRSGKTAGSWDYEIELGSKEASITWSNSNENKGIPIVVLIQYGHGTRNGGYVQPIDFVNPAMKDIFQQIADDAWKEVTSL